MLFLDLVNFVKEEAKLATDPTFLPKSLTTGEVERNRVKSVKQRTSGARSFVSSFLARRSSPVSHRESSSKGGQKSEFSSRIAQYAEKPIGC